MSNHTRSTQESTITFQSGDANIQANSELSKLFKELVDPQSDLNWVRFAYKAKDHSIEYVEDDNQRCDFEDAIKNLQEELDDSSVCFIFLKRKFQDRLKVVYISWVGEAVPAVIKGGIANNSNRVLAIGPKPHLTLQARMSENLENIDEKLQRSAGARY